MIGVISGQVLFSDGVEVIIDTPSGIGYQTFCKHILPEGETTSVYISHIIRENNEALYAFCSLREKKLFELITTVKSVGPKSAFNLISQLDMNQIITSIQTNDKKTLTQVRGLGPKAASQIILDLQKKIQKIKMYSDQPLGHTTPIKQIQNKSENSSKKSSKKIEKPLVQNGTLPSLQSILDDTLLACKNLGFSDERIIPLAQRILKENEVKKTEQLVHLVLKEI